jgi:hypothetical protein
VALTIWPRQQNDVMRLDALAIVCRGRIGVAAVLADKHNSLSLSGGRTICTRTS